MKYLIAICSLVASVVTADAAQRVRITRPAQPPAHPIAIVVLLPPLAVMYDIERRRTCNDYLGFGGPGFDEPLKPGMNVLPPRCG